MGQDICLYISQGLSHLIGLPVSHCNGEEVQGVHTCNLMHWAA
jgi:hypothetical protein